MRASAVLSALESADREFGLVAALRQVKLDPFLDIEYSVYSDDLRPVAIRATLLDLEVQDLSRRFKKAEQLSEKAAAKIKE